MGTKTYVLETLDICDSEIGFPQPVALNRLVPFQLSQLEAPVNAEDELWIDIKSNVSGRTDRWLARRIVSQQASGNVRLESADQLQS